jgi:hypothetical protein
MEAEKISCDYLEYGTFTGGSFIAAYHALKSAFADMSTPSVWNTEADCVERAAIWKQIRFFAFDSFEGLPELHAVDRETSDFVPGKFSCSRPDFERNLANAGVPLERLRVVPGWFNESLTAEARTRHGMQRAAIVHVDCDLYESALQVLEFITPLLVEGSAIIFDDWYNFKANPNLGEQRACREWLHAHPEWQLVEYQKEGPWRNSFIAVKTPS